MKKTLDYLYIFSKLSTSLVLLSIIIVLIYFFYVSFKNQEISKNSQYELIKKLNQNVQDLSKLSNKIKNTESSLSEIKKSIQIITKPDKANEIILIKSKIEELNLKLKNISANLLELKTSSEDKSQTESPNNITATILYKNKQEIIKLIIYKFENNLDITEELNFLQNINSENQYIFEKINLILLKNFRGNEFLKNIYSKEVDIFLKTKYNKNSSNIITKSIMNFVEVEPSKINIIKNNETLILKEIRALLEEKNYKLSYNKIITIENHQKFFTKTIEQIQIANDFKELIYNSI